MNMKQVHEAAHRMRSPEMKPLLDWLREERSAVLELLTLAKPESLQILQGEARRIKTILDLVDGAQAVLTKMEGR